MQFAARILMLKNWILYDWSSIGWFPIGRSITDCGLDTASYFPSWISICPVIHAFYFWTLGYIFSFVFHDFIKVKAVLNCVWSRRKLSLSNYSILRLFFSPSKVQPLNRERNCSHEDGKMHISLCLILLKTWF